MHCMCVRVPVYKFRLVRKYWKTGRYLNTKLLWFTIGFCVGIVKARQALISVALLFIFTVTLFPYVKESSVA